MGAQLDGRVVATSGPPTAAPVGLGEGLTAAAQPCVLPGSPRAHSAPFRYIYIYIYIIYNIGLSRARSLLSLAHSIFTLGDRTLISFLSAIGGGGCLPGAGLLDSSQDVGGAGWVMGDRASVAPAQPSPGQGPRGARSVWPPPDQAVTGSPGPLGLPGQSRWASGVAGGPGHSGFGEAPRTLGSSPPLGSGGAGGPQGLGQR